jgi:transposase-like protein
VVKRKRFSVEQITSILKQAELGTPVAGLCRIHGVSEQSYFRWKKIYGGMEPSEARELKQLREENIKLKRLVADLSLDKAMLQDVLQNNSEARRLKYDRGLPERIASGMSIIDTIDGSLMNVAYEWGLASPAARIRYNLAVTTLSVAVALIIGTLEILGLVGDRLRLQGTFWHRVAAIDLNVVGLTIVGLFMFAWGIALVTQRLAHPRLNA